MSLKALTFFCLLFLPGALSFGEEADLVRTWTSSDGSRSFEGKAVKYDGKQVGIARKGQNPKTFAIAIFSEEDQKWLEENKELIQNPPAPNKKNPAENIVARQFGDLTYSMNEKPGLVGAAKALWGKKTVKKTAKYYILLYSASWCAPCRQDMPHVVKLYKESITSDPDIDLILCSFDHDAKSMKEWAEKEGMTFPILPEDKQKKVPLADQHSPRGGFSSSFLIDASTGEVLHTALPTGCHKAYTDLKNKGASKTTTT